MLEMNSGLKISLFKLQISGLISSFRIIMTYFYFHLGCGFSCFWRSLQNDKSLQNYYKSQLKIKNIQREKNRNNKRILNSFSVSNDLARKKKRKKI